MASRQETLLRDRMMAGVRRRDDDQVDGLGKQLLDARDERDIGIPRVPCSAALHDRGEAEARDGANDGGVEHLAREPEPDEADGEKERVHGVRE